MATFFLHLLSTRFPLSTFNLHSLLQCLTLVLRWHPLVFVIYRNVSCIASSSYIGYRPLKQRRDEGEKANVHFLELRPT